MNHMERIGLVKLIEQQAERIKELEATLESRTSTNAGWKAYYALRQRISDAPVVRTEAVVGLGVEVTGHLIRREDLL